MLHRRKLIPVLVAVLLVLAAVCLPVSCKNGSIATPDPVQNQPIQPGITNDHGIPVSPNISELDLLKTSDISVESFGDLPVALDDLRKNNGGATTIDLDDGFFALHVWDSVTGYGLQYQAVVKCGDSPATLWDILGVGIFTNATNPLTISVYADGYELATIVKTNANVISIPLERLIAPKMASVFGIANSFGYDNMYFYSDTLLTDAVLEPHFSAELTHVSYELDYDPYVLNGLSAFLFGSIDLPDENTNFDIMGLPVLYIAPHFAWNLWAQNPSSRMFHFVNFDLHTSPAGTVSGDVALPEAYCGEEFLELGTARIWALPTAILLRNERYCAMGPHYVLRGEDPTKLEYRCPWFEPPVPEDRRVLAIQFELADGSADIVHANWHGDATLDPISLSGIPEISIPDFTVGAGFAPPQFTITNPLDKSGCITRIHACIEDVGPLWDITFSGGPSFIDAADYGIPLTWLRDLLDTPNLKFRVECIDATSQNIDEFTDHGIIMTRNEVALSAWTDPAG